MEKDQNIKEEKNNLSEESPKKNNLENDNEEKKGSKE